MRLTIRGKEPSHIVARGCEPGDVIRNTKGNLCIVNQVDDDYVYFMVLSRSRKFIDKMYGYARYHVDEMLNAGKYKLVGKANIPEIEIEFYD